MTTRYHCLPGTFLAPALAGALLSFGMVGNVMALTKVSGPAGNDAIFPAVIPDGEQKNLPSPQP